MARKVKYEYTKTPLSYQITEYDCGLTTILNALRYLFKRDEIEPRVLKMITEYTLDKTNDYGEIGKGGTSIYAMEYLSNWFNELSNTSNMKLVTKIIKGKKVSTENEELIQCLNNGGVAILSVWLTEEHYVLCTKLDDTYAYLFDPYYLNINYFDSDDACEIIKDRPFEFNRKVKKSRLDKKSKKDYAFVDGKESEILIINKKM